MKENRKHSYNYFVGPYPLSSPVLTGHKEGSKTLKSRKKKKKSEGDIRWINDVIHTFTVN